MPIQSESEEGRRRRLEGSRKGALTVQQLFGEVLTRKRFAAEVGIATVKTLKRWEEAGVVTPTLRQVGNVDTYVFTEADVEVGKRVKRILAEQNGRLTLAEAARLARSEIRRATRDKR